MSLNGSFLSWKPETKGFYNTILGLRDTLQSVNGVFLFSLLFNDDFWLLISLFGEET